MIEIQLSDDTAVTILKFLIFTLNTIPKISKENTSDSSASPILSIDMSRRWYNYKDVDEIIRLTYQKMESLYLPFEQDL